MALLSAIADDGGCEQTLPADDWVQVLTINVSIDPGATVFEIADDQYANENNRGYYLSLNGQDLTGSIFTFSTGLAAGPAEPAADALVISPNPASDRVMINLPGHVRSPWVAMVLDASGRAVLQLSGTAKAGQMDISRLQSGRYLLQLDAGDWSGKAPLIVTR